MAQKAALTIPVLANIDSLRAAMAAGVSVIATTRQEMAKMGNAFDGSKIIAQAGAIANKFKDVTDVTKLTAKEQAQVNKTLDEAIQKYKALGQSAPAHVQALYDATKKAETSTGLLGGAVAKMASAFAIGSLIDKAVTGIFSLGREAIASAGHIVDLSNKTGLSLKSVQQFGYVANQTGTTIDVFADASFKLGQQLANGGGTVASGLKAIGVSMTTIRSLKPEEQFDTVMRKLAAIEDPIERNKVGIQLMGKAYAQVAGSVSDYVEAMEQAPVATDGAIKATDAAADAVGRAWDNAKATAINAIGGILMAWERGSADAKKAAEGPGQDGKASSPLPALSAMGISGLSTRMILGLQPTIGAARMISPAGAEMGATPQAIQAAADYVKQVAAARTEILALGVAQRAQIEAALKLGTSMDDVADTYGLSANAAKLYSSVAQDLNKTTKKTISDAELLADAERALYPVTETARLARERYNATVAETDAALDEHFRRLAQWSDGTFGPRVDSLPMGKPAGPLKAPGQMFNPTFTEKSTFGFDPKALGQGIAQSITLAVQGGGNVAQSVGSTLGSSLGSSVAKKFGGSLTSLLGTTLGGAVSSMLPGVGALIGPLMGKIADVFAGGEGHKANQLRDSLKAQLTTAVTGLENDPAIQAAMAKFNSAGSRKNVQAAFDETSKAAAAANAVMQKYGLSLEDIGTESAKLSKRTDALAKDFEELRGRGFSLQQVTKGAAAQLNSMLGTALETGQKLPASLQPYILELTKAGLLNDDLKSKLLGVANPVPWQDMQAAAEKFGISTEALGKQFEQAKLNAGTKDLSDAWELLVKNGADINAVMSGMQDEVSAYVQKAQAMGLEIPASMKPIIDKMAEQGLLTDRNSEKLEGIGKLKYADPIVSDTDKLIAKLDELIEKLTGPNGLQAAFDGITFNTPGTGGTSHPETAHHGALVLAGSIRKYHQGTARVLPFPRLSADEFPAILQTGEAVLNRRAVQNIGELGIQAMNRGGGVAGGSVVFQVTNHIHQQPGQDEQALARMVGTILERNTNGLRTKLKRAVNG